MVVEPLAALAVGEEAVARSTLGRGLKRGLCSRNLDGQRWCGQQSRSRRVHGWWMHRPQSACIGKARLLVGMFQLLLEGYPCSGNVSRLGGEVTVDGVAGLLVGEVLHGLEGRRTSDLRTACETDGYRRSSGVGGGVLGLSHPVGLMDPLAAAELAVLSRARAEPGGLIVTCWNHSCWEQLFTTFSK